MFCELATGMPLSFKSQVSEAERMKEQLKRWKDFGETCIAELSGCGEIPRSPCLNLALLRKLLVISRDQAHEVAKARVEELLKLARDNETHNDTTFATKYVVLCEEKAQQKFALLQDPAEWPNLSLEQVFQKDKPEKETWPAKILQDIGEVRYMVQQYALSLCDIADDKGDIRKHDTMQAKVDGLLQTQNESLKDVCRSMRLYCLKIMERKKGVSFVRGALAEPPLSDAPWVLAWRELHDIDFTKFIGAALVPKWNPFSGEDETEEYSAAKAAVLEMMTSNTVHKLDKYAQDCSRHDPKQQKKYVAGLLWALCQEPGLLAALEEEGHAPPWRAELNKWLATTQVLPVTD
jgi:hypothetical protein